jgi:hypothetical protein
MVQHHEYVTALAELRPLFLRISASEAVSRAIWQVKVCYAFQQYDAACAMCRILIEVSVRDICVRRNLFPDLGENVVLFEKFRWSDLREKVARDSLRERLDELYKDLCAVIHGRRTVSKDEARKQFEETLQVVEQLYASHGY